MGKRLRYKLMLGIGSVVLTLVICEAVLRSVGFGKGLGRRLTTNSPWIVYDHVVGRANQPGFVHEAFVINSVGFRGAEIERRKPTSTLRIACLGDSATFGTWRESPFLIRRDVAYPDVLGRLLAAKGLERIEVINAGVLGYTTAHGIRQFLSRILPLEPDIVTLRFGNNDHGLERGQELSFLAGVSAYQVLQALPFWVHDWQLVLLGFHLHRQFLPPPPERRAWAVPIDRFEQNIQRFVALGRKHRVRILFLDYPYRPFERGTSPGVRFPNYFTDAQSMRELHEIHDQYQRVQQRVAADTGTPLCSTQGRLHRSHVPVFSDHDMSHPNEAGSELLAHLLLEKLEGLGWLPQPAGRIGSDDAAGSRPEG